MYRIKKGNLVVGYINKVVLFDYEKLIKEYKEKSGKIIPIWFDECKLFFEKHDLKTYNDTIVMISKVLPKDVSYRFLKTQDGIEEVYEYIQGNKFIKIKYMI